MIDNISDKSLQISPNVLNLPMTVRAMSGTTVTKTMAYTYLGDGTKTGARVCTLIRANGRNFMSMGHAGKRYCGSFVYDVAAVVSLSGRNETIIPSPSGRKLRLPVPTASLILEQNDYLPFGTRMAVLFQKVCLRLR